MVDREKLAQRLMATFLEELRDHVATLNRELLALEAGPTAEHRAEIFKVLFRAAHSLKGAARAVNVDLLERVCHRLEDILDASRSESIEFTPKLFALLFKSIDGIDDVGTQLRQSKDLTGSRLVDLLPALEEEATIAREAKKDKPPHPTRVVQAPSASATPEEGSTTSEKSAAPLQPAASAPEAKSAPPKRMTTSTVRVASDKLDALLAQTGELLVARRRVEQHSKDINSLRQELLSCKANWQAIERPVRRIRQSLETSPHAQELKQILAAIDHGRELVTTLDRGLEDAAMEMAADSTILNQACMALEGEVYRVRMLPFVEACSGLERAIRDIARSMDKQVKLVIVGEDVEIDRGILDALKDPLLHLVRNAIDHGIEAADQRAASGKPPEATVTVSASLRGQHVEITVQDDGRGFDLAQIREKALSKGLAAPDSEEEVARLVFVAGFSTASIITDISGRGVGLDVVQAEMESLQGSVGVSFEPGRGSCFTLKLPLTLTTTRAIMVRAGHQTYAIPTANVEQILRIDPKKQIASVGGRHVATLGGPPLAISKLTNILDVDDRPDEPGSAGMLAVVVTSGQQQAVIVVDELLAEQDVTIKPLGSRIRRVRHVSGATLYVPEATPLEPDEARRESKDPLRESEASSQDVAETAGRPEKRLRESGRIALVLNMANVVRSLLSLKNQGRLSTVKKHRLLVVDDSVTYRVFLQGILDAAGFDVDTAADGQNALNKLRESRFDLVVSDVDMPAPDGFQLAQEIRTSRNKDFAKTPIVLVTARGTDEDKARGAASGADAYIVKSGFDQSTLLETIRQLL